MIEILVSGNPTKDFKRLGVNPTRTYGTYKTHYQVYEVTEEDFKILCDEPDTEDTWEDCGWRHCDGSNQGDVNITLKVNDKPLECWLEHDYIDALGGSYNIECDNLLNYLCDELGASTFKNVCALTKDLAKYNNMKLSELFEVYQGQN